MTFYDYFAWIPIALKHVPISDALIFCRAVYAVEPQYECSQTHRNALQTSFIHIPLTHFMRKNNSAYICKHNRYFFLRSSTLDLMRPDRNRSYNAEINPSGQKKASFTRYSPNATQAFRRAKMSEIGSSCPPCWLLFSAFSPARNGSRISQ